METLFCVNDDVTMDLFGCNFSWNYAKEDGGKNIILVRYDMA